MQKFRDKITSPQPVKKKIRPNAYLNPIFENGDLIVIHDSGAHGHAMGYNYNGRLRSAEVLHQADGGFRLIRRAETAQDYFATLDMDESAAQLGL